MLNFGFSQAILKASGLLIIDIIYVNNRREISVFMGIGSIVSIEPVV